MLYTYLVKDSLYIVWRGLLFSIITIEGDTTMGDILKYEQIVYSALTAIYIIIMGVVQGDDNGDSGLLLC